MAVQLRCACGFDGTAPDAYAFRDLACPGCRRVVQAGSIIPVARPAKPSADVDLSAIVAVDGGIRGPARLMPREPWFYGFLVICARLALVVGPAYLGYSSYAVARAETSEQIALGTALVLILDALARSSAVLFVAVAVLLAVDIGRNVRVVRYHR